YADRNVEIEADPHAEAIRKPLAGPELPIGDPLHIFDELDLRLVGTGAKLFAACIVRLLPLLRPFPPRRLESATQRLETGEVRQQRSPLGAERLEILARGVIGIGAECLIGRAQ